MKKAGILFGQEDTFPQALIDRVNSRSAGVVAEPVRIDKLIQGSPRGTTSSSTGSPRTSRSTAAI